MIKFEGIETKVLVATYNACAELLGSKPVNKFADRATAEKRTAFLLSQVSPSKRPEPFREEDPEIAKAAQAAAEAKAALDAVQKNIVTEVAMTAGPVVKGEDDDGERPKASATQDAETTPKPPKPAPAKGADKAGSLLEGMRAGTKLAVLTSTLLANKGKYVSLASLIRAVYGAEGDDVRVLAEFKGPIGMVMKGLTKHIAETGVALDFIKQKNGKDVQYGIFDRK